MALTVSRRAILQGVTPVFAAAQAQAGMAPTGIAQHSLHPSMAGSVQPDHQTPGRLVGLAYSLWHSDNNWNQEAGRSWGTPLIGFYRSDDRTILQKHAVRLSQAGVDFICIDWSNDLNFDVRRDAAPPAQRFIERATLTLFDVWRTLCRHPKIVIMIGDPLEPAAPSNGHLQAKADEVFDLFCGPSPHAGMMQTYLGKPLLMVYVNSPSPYQDGLPDWADDRFTVRWVTAFINEQPRLKGPPGGSRYGFWSWEEIGNPTYTVQNGQPECMTVVAAWRAPDTPGRQDGRTYVAGWEYARKIGPRIVLGGTFNEWKTSEQPSATVSKDVEDSEQFGTFYLDTLAQQAAWFKAGR